MRDKIIKFHKTRSTALACEIVDTFYEYIQNDGRIICFNGRMTLAELFKLAERGKNEG